MMDRLGMATDGYFATSRSRSLLATDGFRTAVMILGKFYERTVENGIWTERAEDIGTWTERSSQTAAWSER